MALWAPWFAVAGLVAAAGPILIHLLNRRRFRVVQWAAMDFLREAVRRSRRILRLRDVLLMILRTLCLLAFGVAMARPYFSHATGVADPDQPLHGVLLIDNSLSMSYQEIDGTLLDAAKVQAKHWIEHLPAGSRVSVVPLGGSATGTVLGAYPTREDAVEALAAIEVMDRAVTAAGAIDLALEACRRLPDMPAKQIMLIGDQQLLGQSPQPLVAQLERLPARLQTTLVSAKDPENAWVAQFKLRDDIADLQTPAVFLATIRYQGSKPRRDVQVMLTVDGVAVASSTVDLLPDQAREISFPPYQFHVATEPGRPTFVTAEVSITHDRLPLDDQRFLVVPVVAALPVVFVDQYGAKEDRRANRYGETWPLRRLLAPVTARDDAQRQLIQVRQATIDQLDRDLLQDARLVVIAGVQNPGPAVALLRQYVLQGGQLVIAAGGEFDPGVWTATAWLDGAGILPAPLKPALVGRSPDETSQPLQPFQLDFQSMVHDYFLLEQVPHEELAALYHEPYFFKAAVPDLGDAAIGPMIRAMTEELGTRRARLAEIDRRLAELASAESQEAAGGPQAGARAQLEQQRLAIQPAWLLWSAPQSSDEGAKLAPAEAAQRARPRLLATLSNSVPFLVERRLGQGRVLFVSSGFSLPWSTLPLTNTMVIFDRILRDMLQRTFPPRNITTDQQHVEPVSAAERLSRFTLTGPKGYEESLSVDAIGGDRYGVTTGNLPRRGNYRLTASRMSDNAHAAPETKLWEIPIAVNGPADESQLRPPDPSAATGPAPSGPGSTGNLWESSGATTLAEAGQGGSQSLWKVGMWGVLGCLLLEMVVLALPSLRKGRAA